MAIDSGAAVGRGATDTNLDKFLTPEAMLTPGVAGSMTMMIGNALNYNFDLPNGWVILAVSFVFGLLVLVNNKPFLQRSALYVLNSLVIFCVAAGTATLSAKAQQAPASHVSLFVGTAHAQNAPADIKKQDEDLSAQHNALLQRLKNAQPGQDVSSIVGQLEQVDRKRSELASALAAQAKQSTPNTPAQKTFFAPLRF